MTDNKSYFRIRDRLKAEQWDQIPQALSGILQQVLGFADSVRRERERNDENVLLIKCIEKAGEFLNLFISSWDNHIRQACIATRGMLELNLLIRLFEEDSSSRMKFYHTIVWEEKELWQSFIDESSPSSSVSSLSNWIKDLNEIEKKHNLSKEKDYIRPNWSRLSKQFGVQKDYQTIYRLCSIFMHVTPYSVLRMDKLLSSTSELRATWNILLTTMQLYLNDLLLRLSRIIGLEIPSYKRENDTQLK